MPRQRIRDARGFRQDLGRALRAGREKVGITREQLAFLVPCDKVAVQRWESGDRIPPADDMERLLEVFGHELRGLAVLHDRQPRQRWNTAAPTTVFLVEDNAEVRARVKTSLVMRGIRVVGEASSREGAFGGMQRLAPEVAIIDIRLANSSGLDLARDVRISLPHVKLLILSGYDYPQYIRRAAAIGVEGYLTKAVGERELAEAVSIVASGGTVFPLDVASRVFGASESGVSEPPEAGRLRLLTLREMEALELLAHGLSNKEIASQLGVSLKTVEEHVTGLLRKLGIRRRAEAVHLATKVGCTGRVVPE